MGYGVIACIRPEPGPTLFIWLLSEKKRRESQGDEEQDKLLYMKIEISVENMYENKP